METYRSRLLAVVVLLIISIFALSAQNCQGSSRRIALQVVKHDGKATIQRIPSKFYRVFAPVSGTARHQETPTPPGARPPGIL
ncbi:hypothetical protein OWV82_007653 [Melia azedarach]|uniref:Uncharacterized protein n=1 Tax=Melia azedarach TaxID=155640 RepID=A0ACC1Y8G0_MELAZ|nr:hypothetical protein OWV82_007653 [Melia azedarach]